jgi:hypothetical protein
VTGNFGITILCFVVTDASTFKEIKKYMQHLHATDCPPCSLGHGNPAFPCATSLPSDALVRMGTIEKRIKHLHATDCPRIAVDPLRASGYHSHLAPHSSSPAWHPQWGQVRIDRQQTASTNDRPLGAPELATMIPTQQRARRCQRLPNAAHPLRLRDGGRRGRRKVIRGRRQRRRVGASLHDHQLGGEDCRVEVTRGRS